MLETLIQICHAPRYLLPHGFSNTFSDYYKMLIGGDPSKSNSNELEDLIEVSLFIFFPKYISKVLAPH